LDRISCSYVDVICGEVALSAKPGKGNKIWTKIITDANLSAFLLKNSILLHT
jgi:hypothetical protein